MGLTLKARKMLKKENERTWTELIWLRLGTISEYGNEHFSSSNGEEFRRMPESLLASQSKLSVTELQLIFSITEEAKLSWFLSSAGRAY
jgi:hypothetical protein